MQCNILARNEVFICGQDQQKDRSIEINKTTCIIEYKMKENCGCEFIKPVSGFECHLCKLFLRNGNEIEEHIGSLLHMTIYKMHLQTHIQHQNGINHNQTNINRESTEDDLAANQNHGVKECDTSRNCFIRNSVHDDSHGRESYTKVSNTEERRKRPHLNGVGKELTEKAIHESGTTNISQDMAENTGIALPNGELVIQNLDRTFNENQVNIHEGLVDGQDSQENVTEHDFNDVHLNGKMSATKEHIKYNETDTSFEGTQKRTYRSLKVKQEEENNDNVDVDEDNGIIGGFLEDSDDELFIPEEHYNGELIPGYITDKDLKTESIGQEVVHILTSGANSASIVEETCTTTTTLSDNRWPASISENTQKHAIDGTSEADNCEKTSTTDEELNVANEVNGNLDISTCEEPQSLEKGSCEGIQRKRSRDGPFPCDFCGKSFNLKGHLKEHEMIHAGEKPYSCDVCGMKFAKSNDCKQHRRIHSDERPYLCNLCGKSFKQSSYLKLHERMHAGEEPYSCELCGKSFNHKSALRTHERIHTGERPFTCSVCGKSFKQSSNLKSHERIHIGKEPYSCDECGMKFSRSRIFMQHKKIHTEGHIQERPYSCDECGKKFSKANYCTKHKWIHTGERPFSCNDCGKSFKQKGQLKAHERVHTGERPFSCNFCGKSFKNNGHLIDHKRMHTGERPFSCTVCDKSFKRSGHLKAHKIVHAKLFSCNVCGNSFKERRDLEVHERLHAGERLFLCNVCRKSFKTKGSLKAHKMVHARPFSCNICAISFNQRRHLEVHEMIHTGEIDVR